ncbi:uncharacterized protein LOC119772565 [Cyprinodon tularosa]|uniref:uncharacterized protein LOC119772565 n=1 Tax=Cyprinodon tularosa TaxID=77115 RepID=UPI0018E229DC|nr:uncharacterized protein LOC119772565 [Cyprinodon tularosa]
MALNEQIKDELATLDEPASLDDFIRLAIRLDNRIRARNSSKKQSKFSSATHNMAVLSPSTEQMPTQSSKPQTLSLPVQASHSGERDNEPMQVEHTRLSPEERQRRFLGKLCIYCGCERNLIDSELVQQLQIKTIPLSQPLSVSAIDGKRLHRVTHQTQTTQIKEYTLVPIFPVSSPLLNKITIWVIRHLNLSSQPHAPLEWSTGK